MRIGFHASHEQHSPGELLGVVARAEEAGFDAAMCSDHFAPWGARQGHSGHAWTWLGAALASTAFPIGVVTSPAGRYHPAVLAQAIATAAEMFPGRFWAALGSGEALNEHIIAKPWPPKEERDRRLHASAALMQDLLRGKLVSAAGTVQMHQARIWSLPKVPPPLLAAAVSPHTAAETTSWADGLITVAPQGDEPSRVKTAYRQAGGRGPAYLQVHLCLEDDEAEAMAAARDQWWHAGVPADRVWDLALPDQFDEFGPPDDAQLRGSVLVSSSVEELAAGVRRLGEGFDGVFLHHVGKDQHRFLERAEKELLPALRETA
ncbi:LLM class F420-dependent oxidoreductase [Microbacterium sp. 8M]|uniref:TIGR03557 family F420-dependent LLM class oxidoreductase n=1 Tax=Microbacterium sp. 8M TaxID=2653153 RepID=UPI0012EF6E7D|nr:TIGR03557 family F420-dependent LLM class oxidoreductase [Microbacterium sp. 8M]VXC28794.1 LLM class F420-dependent oxidoreductase [Microbacterium sp. 8M]